MDNSEKIDNKFDYYEVVRVKNIAPTSLRPGEAAAISGIKKNKSNLPIEANKLNEGVWVYIIKYIEGGRAEIPECYLEKYDDEPYRNKFTWGDSVVIVKDAPPCFHPGEVASICGIHQILSEEDAEEFQCHLGNWVYTVEFLGGADMEIAETFLERYEDK